MFYFSFSKNHKRSVLYLTSVQHFKISGSLSKANKRSFKGFSQQNILVSSAKITTFNKSKNELGLFFLIYLHTFSVICRDQ